MTSHWFVAASCDLGRSAAADVLAIEFPLENIVIQAKKIYRFGGAAAMAARSSVSFALIAAAFSGPIRISNFCPAGRDSSAGSAKAYMTFGRTSAMGPVGCGAANRLSITCTSLSLKYPLG